MPHSPQSFERSCLVGLLGDAAHLCADVTQYKETDSCDDAGNLGHPESHVPAMVLGNGAKGQSRQEATHCQRVIILHKVYMLSQPQHIRKTQYFDY